MGEAIELKRPDGNSCAAYLAEPNASAAAPGVVVIQEWWGLNDQIKGVANRLAEAGYRALVPDLFRGKLARNADEANYHMAALDFAAAARQDIRGAAQHLKATGSQQTAVWGYCMGGALSIIGAAHVPELDAAVCFYGLAPEAAADPRTIRIPFCGHFAENDEWCSPPAVAELEQQLAESGVPHEIHRYDASHAFCNESRPEVYDPGAAKHAWERSIAFLARTFSLTPC